MLKTFKIVRETNGNGDMLDITNEIKNKVKSLDVKAGFVTAFILGSTAAVTTIEFEPGLKKDFPDALEKIAPSDAEYKHHETWHDYNGHSHVKASLIGPSLTVPFENSKLALGTWQQIVLVDFDTRPRKREIVVQVFGE